MTSIPPHPTSTSSGIPVTNVFPLRPLVVGEANTLVCLVENIYPPAVEITWQLGEVPVTHGVTHTPYTPTADFSFLRFSYLTVTPAHLLYLSTLAGAEALDLHHLTGDLSVGKQFDAVLLNPQAGTPLRAVYDHAGGPERLLAATFASGTSGDVARVWIGGDTVYGRGLEQLA